MGVDRAVLFHMATSERLKRISKAVPGGETAAWRAASRYVAGRSSHEALRRVAGLLQRGHTASVDLFGELVRDTAAAERVVEDYQSLATALPPDPADVWLSVDLTHLALDTDPSGAADRLAAIAGVLPIGRRVQVGAEDADHTDAVLTCILDVAGRGLAGRLGATVQANLLRSFGDVDTLISAAVHVRLVKGAYVETTGALPYGEPTDVAYLRLVVCLSNRLPVEVVRWMHRKAAEEGHSGVLWPTTPTQRGAAWAPQTVNSHLRDRPLTFRLGGSGAIWSMATHDGRLREALLLALGRVPVEQLLGVRPDVLDELRDREVPTRVYVPYGPDWFRYWIRRLAESRGA